MVVLGEELVLTVVLDDTDTVVTMAEELEVAGAVVDTVTTVGDVEVPDVNLVSVELEID